LCALEDLRETKRINQTTVGACMTCKTVHFADIFKEKRWDYAKIPLMELLSHLKHPIVCASCHDPKTINLRVINPAFIEAMAELDKARGLVRKAQWYWDFVAAENSMGFHNPTMVLNTLGRSIDLAHQAITTVEKASGGR
jgi:formate-dependent nitrite reductase cytochrome c552 subunit